MSDTTTHLFSSLFEGCPDAWSVVPLHEAVDFREGPGILAKDFHDDGVPLLRLKSIQNTFATLDGCNFLDEAKVAKKWDHFRVEVGDMLVSTSATIGIVSEVTKKTVGSIPYTGIIRMRPNRPDVAPGFIKYFMKSSHFTQQAEAMAGGAVLKHYGPSHLRQMLFPIPPFSTQRKIASILSAYDDLIENNTRRIAILEEMAQAIYREWFVNFRFPGHENVKLVDSPLGQIPEGWEVAPLPQLCSKLTDGTHDSPKACDEGFPLVTGKHLNNGVIEFERCYLISPSDHEEVMRRCRPESGDIIFSNIGTLGNTVLVDGDHEFSIKNVALFKPIDRPNSHFLFLYLSRKETLESMIQRASGTSQKFLSLAFLRREPVAYPPQDVLRLFNERVSALIEDRAVLHKTNRNLRTTRDLLLPKLISGKLDVEDLKIDVGMTAEALEEATA